MPGSPVRAEPVTPRWQAPRVPDIGSRSGGDQGKERSMARASWIKMVMAVAVLGLLLAACPSTDGGDGDTGGAAPSPGQTADDDGGDDGDSGQASGDTMQAVQDRGTLVCGVNGQVPGFSFVDEQGAWSGFDVDYCKAIAAVVLDDPEAVEYRALTAQERFTALQSGEIDVLIRNTTWTASRDGGEGGNFAVTTFYDGQGMMVPADAGISSLEDLDGATICVLSGTTTELNLTTAFEARGLSMTPQSFEDNEPLQAAFQAGQCQGWTSDKSQLASLRQNYPEGPEALTILDVTMSKEPLGPVTRDGDTQWSDAVNWIVIATIQAEEFGLTQSNIGSADTEDPDIGRFVGAPGVDEEGNETDPTDPGLGLPTDYAVTVVEAVGNYGEIYERHLTPLGLERGLNQLWNEGGLHYPPPYR